MFWSGLIATYALTSICLLKWPHWIHPRRSRRPCYKHISHRGGAGEGPENTLLTFRRAIALGTDMLEIDCHLTQDHIPVVVHDANLKRLTGVDALVRDVKFQDLPPLLPRLPLDFVPGQAYHVPKDMECAKLMALEDVFRQFPGIGVNIDIKVHDEKLVQAVSEIVTRYDALDTTVWGSFRQNTTDLCHATNPDIGLFASFPRVLKILLLFYLGLLPFVPLKETHFEIPMPRIFATSVIRDPPQGVIRSALARTANFLLMSPILFKHLEKRGIQTYIWVLNNEEEFERAFLCGATGIMTDYPSKLKLFQLSQGMA
ncbi:hypothetical protein TCAL_01603 [Tigriopus californicus]|uniref:GP-PDE domain-containing protein n=1 Tax=Tigriopus californicus TaxID=6832 RepID=A0A553PAL8_TIGCA|nr:lysophospholipase D GDPD1-like [Tigriopus californicus]TRY74731.1 hypothetical protein TCAL_01603 [Tigriopus californicus]|eukprot:TCALIF_01603-PA protein Name:"Similar to GDPD1 Glycerophosphodiester phosphodiesterase domain-containing protein 1 (Homo sapiens)" AED:0.28 eAED:0.28 QI:0/-1/0/1/-1/1/1/0/314